MIRLVLTAALATAALGARAATPPAPRAAILVGAVAPVPGRALLRHAYRDADTMADVLVSVGGFPRDRVHVLRDPDPSAVIAAVEREASALAGAPQGMLFFYYSGHAGEGALFTAGKPLRVDALRRALDRADVSVRIGVVDACEGGGWTRAKGLVPDAPFEVALPAVVESEGSALIASSSGAESAHESDALGGSYFTHHFAAALRGAADERHDGEITLTEAFEYARAQTIRETARQAREPQHPSFAVNLKGRQDLVLAQVATSPSTLAVDQREGPLELVHLASGLRMIELPAGPRAVTLAVPPGKYLVRKVAQGGIATREISVPRDGWARVDEGELVLVGSERLAVKGSGDRKLDGIPGRLEGEAEVSGTALYFERDGLELPAVAALGTGIETPIRFDARLGLTDRLTWKVATLAFAYAFGEPRGWEVIPYGGILGWATDVSGGGRGSTWTLGAGVAGRLPLGAVAMVGTLAWDRPYYGQSAYGSGEIDRAHAALGLTAHLGKHVTLHLAYGLESVWYPGYSWGYGSSQAWSPAYRQGGWSIGSIQDVGLLALPLVAVHVGRGWSANLYARSTTIDTSTENTVRLGIAKAF